MKKSKKLFMEILKDDVNKKDIEEFKKLGYKYIIKAKDNFLSGWGNSANKAHIQIILCRTTNELYTILRDLRNDNSFCYVNWHYLEYKNVYNFIHNKSYTIRNDWTRAFQNEIDKERYLKGE